MGNRLVPLTEGEHYHIYNRGVDKRKVFMGKHDAERFLRCMQVFNALNPVGSLYRAELPKNRESSSSEKLVSIVAYCLNPNHYHFILRQESEFGISEYMKRLNGGYTWYFNKKYKRNGSLFQGRFKSIHIGTDSYLKHLSAYVNLNYKVHQLSGSTAQLVRSSWKEYTEKIPGMCSKDIVLEQFESKDQYKIFAISALKEVLQNREHIEKFELSG